MTKPERGVAQTYQCQTLGKEVWLTNGWCDQPDKTRCMGCLNFKSEREDRR